MKKSLKLIATLRPYQKRARKRALRFDGFALYMKQGTGKTLTALAIVTKRYYRDKVRKLLIIGPIDALDEWEEELRKSVRGKYQHLKLQSKDGKRVTSISKVGSRILQIITINYESLDKHMPMLKAWKPDFVIADESHRIKSRKTQQSKTCWKLGDKSRFRLLLTGTPVEQSPIDAWSQFRFACPEVFGKPWGPFKEKYTRSTGYGYTKLVIRKKNLKELLAKIHSRTFTVSKKVLNLPPQKHILVRFSLSNKAADLYHRLEEEAIVELENEHYTVTRNVLTKYLRLQQLTGGFLPDEEEVLHTVDKQKLKALRKRLIKLKGQKVVIFARFIKEVDTIVELCQELGFGTVCLKGKVKPKKRREARQRFLKDPAITHIVSQIKTGGIAVNEMVAAAICFFYSTTYSWIDYDQALSRVHRGGQTKPVTFIHLLAKNTVDEDIYQVQKLKGTMSDLVLYTKKRRN